ncbi:MAG: hypothetical protein SPF74_03850, partial [Candidatus Limivicinus sp.]|nr:hypothetical protein [Candidatus Limivicinus sp.]
DAGQHGVGQVQAYIDLMAGGGIVHNRPPVFPFVAEGMSLPSCGSILARKRDNCNKNLQKLWEIFVEIC